MNKTLIIAVMVTLLALSKSQLGLKITSEFYIL